MSKACLANEHGTDVFTLLVIISSLEDSKGYRGPVTFWNEQLMPLVGITSLTTFKRVRSKAIESGWLIYQQGSRSKPPKYFVNVPDVYKDCNDRPFDENPDELSSPSGPYLTHNPDSIDPSSPDLALNPVSIRPQCGTQSGLNPAHLPPIPIPIPNTKKSSAEKPPEPSRNPDLEKYRQLWKAKYGDFPSTNWGKDGAAVKWMKEQCSGDAERLYRIFTRYLADDDKFFAVNSRHSLGSLRANFDRWKVDPIKQSREIYE